MDDKNELAKRLLGDSYGFGMGAVEPYDEGFTWRRPLEAEVNKLPPETGEILTNRNTFDFNDDLGEIKGVKNMDGVEYADVAPKYKHMSRLTGGLNKAGDRIRQLFGLMKGPSKLVVDAIEKYGKGMDGLNAFDLIPKEMADGVQKEGAFGYMNRRKHGS